jgi:hypothetical protein
MKPESWSAGLLEGDYCQEKETRSLERVEVNFNLEESTKPQKRSGFIAILFF